MRIPEFFKKLMGRRAKQAEKEIELHDMPRSPILKSERDVEELLERASKQPLPNDRQLLAH